MQSSAPQGGRKPPPGKWLYWLAACLWLLVPLLLMALAIPQGVKLVTSLQEQGTQMDAPGRMALRFQEPGDYAVFVTGEEGEVNATPRGGGIVLRRGLILFLEDEEGLNLSLQSPRSSATVTLGAVHWVRVATFHVSRPGSYTLTAQYADKNIPAPPTRLLVAARDWPFVQILEGLLLLLPLLGTALVCIVLGVGLAMYVYVRRYDAREQRACAL